jgi:prenyltransferase beta subunit
MQSGAMELDLNLGHLCPGRRCVPPYLSDTAALIYRPQTNSGHDSPHIIMTYTALLTLSMLRDDFARLNRPGLLQFVGSCQNRDGRFGLLHTSLLVSSLMDAASVFPVPPTAAATRICVICILHSPSAPC